MRRSELLEQKQAELDDDPAVRPRGRRRSCSTKSASSSCRCTAAAGESCGPSSGHAGRGLRVGVPAPDRPRPGRPRTPAAEGDTVALDLIQYARLDRPAASRPRPTCGGSGRRSSPAGRRSASSCRCTTRRPAYLDAMIRSVAAQTYPHWELCLADGTAPPSHVRPMLEKLAASDAADQGGVPAEQPRHRRQLERRRWTSPPASSSPCSTTTTRSPRSRCTKSSARSTTTPTPTSSTRTRTSSTSPAAAWTRASSRTGRRRRSAAATTSATCSVLRRDAVRLGSAASAPGSTAPRTTTWCCGRASRRGGSSTSRRCSTTGGCTPQSTAREHRQQELRLSRPGKRAVAEHLDRLRTRRRRRTTARPRHLPASSTTCRRSRSSASSSRTRTTSQHARPVRRVAGAVELRQLRSARSWRTAASSPETLAYYRAARRSSRTCASWSGRSRSTTRR